MKASNFMRSWPPRMALALLVATAPVGLAAAEDDGSGASGCTDQINFVAGDLCITQSASYLIPVGETEERDLYLWSQRLDVNGTLDGDLIAWFQSGSIAGTVTQDLAILAQDMRIVGEVGDDVRFLGQNLIIDGTVKGDVLFLGANLVVSDGGSIEGSLLAAGGIAIVNGQVGGDAHVAGGTVTLNGSVAGNAEFLTDGGMVIGPGASIGGDLKYRGPAEGDFDRSIVAGSITFRPKERKAEHQLEILSRFKTIIWILSFITAIIAGTVIVALTRDHAWKTAETIRKKPLKSLGIGFIAFICIPIVVLIAFVLILTIPLSLLLLLAYMIALYIAKFYVSIWLGNLILGRGGRTDKSPIPAMLLGLVVVYLVTAIPVVGTLVGIVIMFFGLGALLQRKETRLNGVFEPPAAPSNGLPDSFPAAPSAPARS
jgi:cytoskeletal protein CcmA (bactofilin family)